MRIHVHPADLGGCGHYRMIWPAEALRAQGADVHLIYAHDAAERQIQAAYWNGDDGSRTLLHATAPECDVVVLQRPLNDVLADSIPILQRQGVRVIVEVDDDFEAISPRNVSWRAVHPSRDPRRNWKHLRRACEHADLIVVSTPALADVYGRHGRVVVVPNCVPESYLWTAGDPHDGVYVGWSGSTDTHPDDLQVTRGAVQKVLRASGASFSVVGTGKGVRAALGLTQPPLACGWQPIDLYPSMLAQLDVGIVPLQPSRFNEAKSWLKGLEMAALGVPFVASPSGPYVQLLLEGAGLIAEHPRAWQKLLGRLVADESWRIDLAGAGREVAERFTIEGNCGRWLEAWESVVNTRCTA